MRTAQLLIAATVLAFIGIGTFTAGFFPTSTPSAAVRLDPLYSLLDSAEDAAEVATPPFARVVLMLVDGMRADFLYGPHSVMHKSRKLIQEGQGLPFVAHADAPTVTMPRIKALMSGGIPNFLDVALNFASGELKSDSVIAQLHKAGRTLVHYGDDTWLKLFPDKWARFDGTTSFYVADTVQVDDNVTRHIRDELPRRADAVILHYLGVDHAGHQLGAYGTLMDEKLREMDHLVDRVFQRLKKLDEEDCEKGSCSPSLFILCSDHGMTDQGNHGGGTHNETASVLVFFSPQFEPLAKKSLHAVDTVAQVDVAPTLALLLGVPVPRGSVGGAIASVLRVMAVPQRLSALRENAHQLHDLLHSVLASDRSLRDAFQHAEDTHRRHLLNPAETTANEAEIAYTKYFHGVRGYVTPLLASYNNTLLVAGVVLMALAALVLVPGWLQLSFAFGGYVQFFMFAGTVLHIVSLTASSFVEEEHRTQYFLVTAGLVLVAVRLLQKLKFIGLFMLVLAIACLRLLRSFYSGGDKFASVPGLAAEILDLVPVAHIAEGTMIAYVPVGLLVLQRFKEPHVSVQTKKTLRLACALSLVCLVQLRYEHPPLWLAWLAYAVSAGLLLFARHVKNTIPSKDATELASAISYIALLGISMMLVKGVNLIVLFVIVVQTLLIRYALLGLAEAVLPAWVFVVLLHWIGRAQFFALGNSNSISTIDIGGSYVGLTGYHPVLVGLLTFVQLYAAPLLTAALSVGVIAQSERPKLTAQLAVVNILAPRLLCLLISATTLGLLRHHLFVWSVFAPKFGYEAVETLFTAVVCCVFWQLRELQAAPPAGAPPAETTRATSK